MKRFQTTVLVLCWLLACSTTLSAQGFPRSYTVEKTKQWFRSIRIGGNFWEAVEEDNVVKVQKQLAKYPELANEPKYNYAMPISLAQSAEMAEVLIAAGADVHKKITPGGRPLCVLIGKGKIDVIRVLLKYEVDLQKATRFYDHSPLHVAAEYRELEIFKMLVEAGERLSSISDISPGPIMTAIKSGSLEIVKYIFKKDRYIDLNAAFHQALECTGWFGSKTSSREIVIFFINEGADVNKSLDGIPPLQRAAITLDLPTIKLMVENGAKVNGLNRNMETVLGFFNKGNFHYGEYNPGLYRVTCDYLVEMGATK